MATYRIREVDLLRDPGICFDYMHGGPSASGVCSVVLVVSPLVSLMVNQVASLQSRRVSAATVGYSSAVSDKKSLATEKDVAAGKYCLLFCAPEVIIGVEKWGEIVRHCPSQREDSSSWVVHVYVFVQVVWTLGHCNCKCN